MSRTTNPTGTLDTIPATVRDVIPQHVRGQVPLISTVLLEILCIIRAAPVKSKYHIVKSILDGRTKLPEAQPALHSFNVR